MPPKVGSLYEQKMRKLKQEQEQEGSYTVAPDTGSIYPASDLERAGIEMHNLEVQNTVLKQEIMSLKLELLDCYRQIDNFPR